LVVRWLIRYVAHHDFIPFVWYRFAFGLFILGTAWSGLVSWD
jgi:undecaprenyl-diphosphatase